MGRRAIGMAMGAWASAALLVGCGGLPGVAPASEPSPTVAPAVTSAPPLPPTATPTPAPEVWAVGNTDGDGVFVRRTPSMEDRLKAWPDRTLMIIVGPDTTAEGRQWKHVRDPEGNEGWIPAEFLIRVVDAPGTKPLTPPPPAATPSPATAKPESSPSATAPAPDSSPQPGASPPASASPSPTVVPQPAASPEAQRTAYQQWKAEFDRIAAAIAATGQAWDQVFAELSRGTFDPATVSATLDQTRERLVQAQAEAANLRPPAGLRDGETVLLRNSGQSLVQAATARQGAIGVAQEFVANPSALTLQKARTDWDNSNRHLVEARSNVAIVEAALGVQPAP